MILAQINTPFLTSTLFADRVALHCGDDIIETQESPVNVLRDMFPAQQRRNHNLYCANSEEEDEGYTMEAVRAIRDGNVELLQQLLARGLSFDACNRNGESLLHLACRRGNLETITFLIEEAHVNVDIRDDLGRTVLHDLCWRPRIDTELMDVLVQKISPALLLAEDRRGHTPFDYVRKSDWMKWNSYLLSKKDMIARRVALLA